MRNCIQLIAFLLCVQHVFAMPGTYVGSTPPHQVIREFLQISMTDSIDFIRWKLELLSGSYKLDCRYGISRPGTPGFKNTQQVLLTGSLSKTGSRYQFSNRDKFLFMLELNPNILQILDRNNDMLIGNGGWSFSLNNTEPTRTNVFNFRSHTHMEGPLVFEGRTPCQDLPAVLGLKKSEACDKMKWFFIFYHDSLTKRPSHFLMAGSGYRKDSMLRGTWELVEEGGRIVYRLKAAVWARPLHLVQGDPNILFFVDPDGRLLVGNEDFSYTLNRKEKE